MAGYAPCWDWEVSQSSRESWEPSSCARSRRYRSGQHSPTSQAHRYKCSSAAVERASPAHMINISVTSWGRDGVTACPMPPTPLVDEVMTRRHTCGRRADSVSARLELG